MLKMNDAATGDVVTQVSGRVGLITLNRPRALNALTLDMVRTMMATLLAWKEDSHVLAVAVRGSNKEGVFGAFCAGGDIRFLHQGGTEGDPRVEDFFTEEYALNHLIHTYPKPYIAFMDGIVMGGGMGISQGAAYRLVTERTRMAMPETAIGLFPDVGGGYFLSRCPGRTGEWLALTGDPIQASEAVALGLADGQIDAFMLETLWDELQSESWRDAQELRALVTTKYIATGADGISARGLIDQYFSLDSVAEIVKALEASGGEWEMQTAATLRKRSPLMLHVVLEQIRRARDLSLADDLRMERDMVRHCFHLRPGQSETLEGIRALAVDKDHLPRWSPVRIEDVTKEMVAPFFVSPWPAHGHPLSALG